MRASAVERRDAFASGSKISHNGAVRHADPDRDRPMDDSRPIHPRNAIAAMEDALRVRIADGVWPPGTQLPSERALAAEFDLSHSTVKRALGFLHREGLLVGHQGKGHFVAGRPARHVTHSVAVVMAQSTDLAYPPVAQTLAGIRGVLHESGYNLNLMAVREHIAPPKHFTRLFGAAPIIDVATVDAAIVIGMPDCHIEPLYTLARHLPVCATWHFLHGPGLGCVLTDYGPGAFSAMRHCHDRGHRHIVFVVPDDRNTAARLMRQSVDYVRMAYPAMTVDVWSADEFLVSEGARAAREILGTPRAEAPARPTAAVFGSDELLEGFVLEARALGVRVPEDLSVTGWNDSIPPERLGLALTTLKSDSARMGALSAQCVLDMLARPEESVPTRVVPVNLIVRDSVRPPRVQ